MPDQFLVIFKPDALQRNLVGKILIRFLEEGFQIIEMSLEKNLAVNYSHFKKLYREHKGKEFYQPLLDFMLSGPIVVSGWSGDIEKARKLVGATDPKDRLPGTIRGDWSTSLRENLVHCSDSPESAQRELEIWFS